MLDSLAGDVSKIEWRRLPVAIVMPLVSLFSGAVLGPEGGIGGISSKLAAMYNEKVGIPVEHRPQLVFSTVASAYNGLIANPLFTGVLGSELIHDPDARARTLPANLIGGAIGYLIFISVGLSGLDNYLHLTDTQPLEALDVVLVVVFGLLGLGLALIAGALFRVAAAIFGRFEGREVERALAAGVVFSVVGVFAPIVMFSGETQVQTVVADPAKYGPLVLILMALVKLALLSVAFKSGFFGGPTFPGIFASVCVALAISLMLPGIRTRRPHRRGDGRLPDGPVQGAVHGHPADGRDAPGEPRGDCAHRPGRRRRADRPAVHPGRDRCASGGACDPPGHAIVMITLPLARLSST